jgi:hypothetical protein
VGAVVDGGEARSDPLLRSCHALICNVRSVSNLMVMASTSHARCPMRPVSWCRCLSSTGLPPSMLGHRYARTPTEQSVACPGVMACSEVVRS